MSRRGRVFAFDVPAGILEETDVGDFVFQMGLLLSACRDCIGARARSFFRRSGTAAPS